MQRDDSKANSSTEIDGAPLSGDEKDDEDLDGVPLDGAALLKSAMMRGIPSTAATASPNRLAVGSAASEAKIALHRRGGGPLEALQAGDENDSDYDDDIDGVPVDEDIDGVPLQVPTSTSSISAGASKSGGGGFLPSKWETVDPDQVEAQAITTSKWDTLEPVAPEPPSFSCAASETIEDDSAAKRSRLREIELKIVQYQDELESGERSLKPGWSIAQQTEHYRRKLMRKDLVAGSASAAFDGSPTAMSATSVRKSSSAKKPAKRSPSPSMKRRSRSPPSKRRYSRDSESPPPKSAKAKRGRSRSMSLDDSPTYYGQEAGGRSRSSGSKTDSSPKRNRYGFFFSLLYHNIVYLTHRLQFAVAIVASEHLQALAIAIGPIRT